MNTIFYIIAGVVFLVSLTVRQKLSATYRKWGKVRNTAGLTGGQTARTILDSNGMIKMPIKPIRGNLSDHYNPRSKTISLSEPVYDVPSVAAMAVAAHEAGHAIQDKEDYGPIELKKFLTPLAMVGARYGIPAAIFGGFFDMPNLVKFGVLAYLAAILVQFITLPVEFNASHRAVEQLDSLKLMDPEEKEGVTAVLKSAAMTYVASVASSAGYILYVLFMAGRWIIRKPLP